MKKLMVVLAAMAFVMVMVGGAWAANTAQTVAVSAAVQSMCKNGTNGTMDFGSIDPGDTATVSKTSSGLTYKCSKGTTFNVSQLASTGAGTTGSCTGYTGTMKSTTTASDTLAYSVTCTAGPYTGKGFSAATPVDISGTISQSQYQDAVPHGDYTDTLTVTIEY
jgi:spore coat protein U-like protein